MNKGVVARVLIYLAIGIGVAIGAYILNNYVFGITKWWSECELYHLFIIIVVIFCTCLILHKIGKLQNKK